MSFEHVLIGLVLGTFLVSALAPFAVRWLGREAGYVIAAWCLGAATPIVLRLPAIMDGEVVRASAAWIPGLGIRFALALDGLAALFSLLVLGIGAVVFAYSARYLPAGREHGGFYGILTLFAGAMLGLVLAEDLFLLFVFWELTSISSYFLIGGRGRGAAGRSATRALLVTGIGGLALLAGLILLGVVAGSSDLGAILSEPGGIREHPLTPAIGGLLLVGVFTKSAQFPFHFWLPGAMVAPTPASTYLHAATMVKAGIYLLIRLAPLFGAAAGWQETVVFTGLFTALLGGVLALKQYDLKRLLAYSTVSQLGFMVALAGAGTQASIAAASVLVVAHALFKSTLFMVVGILDREAGSRDIRLLSGLRRVMPLTSITTGIAALSMAGIPPLLGFISKEEAFAAFLGLADPSWLAPAAATLAVGSSVATFAYSARILDGAFGGPLVQEDLYEPAPSFLAPAAATAVLGLAFGLGQQMFDPLASSIVERATGTPADIHFELWHGATPAFLLSLVTYALGTTLFVLRLRTDEWLHRVTLPVTGTRGFDAAYGWTVGLGKRLGRASLSSSPSVQVGWVLGAVAVVVLAARGLWWDGAEGPAPASRPADWVVAALIAGAALAAAVARARIAAVALIGVVGFLVSVLYVLLGAPDLAITQLLVETLTVTLVVLVFRRLPATFAAVRRARRAAAAAVAAGAGLLAGTATWALAGRRAPSEAARYFLRAAPEEAGGRNVVNTILVDFRALDTLGEVTVVAVAAIGVIALLGRRPWRPPS